MKWWGWLLALLPFGLGWLVALLASNGVIQDPVLYLRGGMAAVAFRAGLLLSAIAVAVGITVGRVRRRHESEIEAVIDGSVQERRRFLQRLDHELKNPLTAIQTGLNNVVDVAQDSYVKGEVKAVKAQVQRVTNLVADLRKLAALETMSIEKANVDLGDLLSEEVQAFQETTDREIALMLPSAPWPLRSVSGDRDLLLLAVHNLLDNALKFTNVGDTVEVRAFEDDREIAIEVADTGPGIPDGEAEQVWDELYRGKGARGIRGSGLGLALVKLIVEKHEGRVSLRSQPGRGTVFTIRLPV
ncbi:MAG: HAMP domain-containing sensor histidine kinase [Anaerolineales bacterium]